ncbi:unnamed protein product [Absidia cylindrospora]
MDFSPYKPSPDENRKRQDGQQKKGKSKSTLSHDPYSTAPSYSPKAPAQPSPYQVGGAGSMSSSLLEEGLFDMVLALVQHPVGLLLRQQCVSINMKRLYLYAWIWKRL